MTPIIAGNWKMNGTLRQAADITQGLLQTLGDLSKLKVEVVLCPPYTALARVAELLGGSRSAEAPGEVSSNRSRVLLGAQDVHWEKQGAYTGEVSAAMLQEIGCRYCIVGHSERRQILQETDSIIQKKLLAAVTQGLRVILCVGETLDQRKAGKTWPVIQSQLEQDLQGFPDQPPADFLVVAYEPVWAIGTGQNATGEQAQEVHAQVRGWLAQRFGQPAAQTIRLQYGGSVKPDNAAELLSQPDVDGALVGGASLDSKAFAAILRSAVQVRKESGCSTA